VHTLRQTGFLHVERPGSSDVLPACPTGFPRRTTPFAAEFKFKFGQAGQHARHHAAGGVGRVDALTQRPQNDIPFAEFANRGHHLGGVSAKPVNSNHDVSKI
jgi:hypothetical protein